SAALTRREERAAWLLGLGMGQEGENAIKRWQLLLGVRALHDSVDGANNRRGTFRGEHVDRPGTAKQRFRADEPRGCGLTVISTQNAGKDVVKVNYAPAHFCSD